MKRRAFFTTASLAAGSVLTERLLARPVAHKSGSSFGAPLHDEQLQALRNELLSMVNHEREGEGLSTLKLDDFASHIATAHAVDMANGIFLSHWGRDGRKPYQRYSLAGGTEAIEENDGSVDHTGPFLTSDEFVDDVLYSHRSMFAELPPEDGHRKTILGPQHTHVGFGMAMNMTYVRLSEIYIARYIAVDAYQPVRRPNTKFLFSGRVLQPTYVVQSIDVFYERLPAPPPIEWLRVARSYGLPSERTTLMPKLPAGIFYENGSRGSIEGADSGRFKVHVHLGKLPGIYTIVAWLQRRESQKAFPATQVCLRVE
jgi:uncharacterized protein YkwD